VLRMGHTVTQPSWVVVSSGLSPEGGRELSLGHSGYAAWKEDGALDGEQLLGGTAGSQTEKVSKQ
jgi:hypothetical protein